MADHGARTSPSSTSAFAADPREPRLCLAGPVLIPIVIAAGIIAAAIAALITARIVGAGAGGSIGAVSDPTGATTGAAALDTVAATPDAVISSLLGSLAAMLVSVPLLIVIKPWKVRAAGTWATIWLGTIVGRLLITPVVGLAVYSATPVRTDAFLLSLAGVYLACLAAEVAVSARNVARSLGAAEADARRRTAVVSPDSPDT